MHPHVLTSHLVLGEPAQNLRVHLRLHHAGPHHHRVLRTDDLTAQERAHAVGFQGKGQEPAQDHQDGAGGRGRVYRLLDPHPHLRHHQSPHHDSRDHLPDGFLALLHRPGLHQQLPEPRSLCVPG